MQISLAEFCSRVAQRLNWHPAMVREAVRAAFGELADLVAAGDSLRVPGLGLFTHKHQVARRVPHPTTGEMLRIEAHDVPMFRAAIGLRRRVWPGLKSGRRRAGKG